jgi:hypothetical protein
MANYNKKPQQTKNSQTPSPGLDENQPPASNEENEPLPPLNYGALHRLALILIDIARNPANPLDKTTDS